VASTLLHLQFNTLFEAARKIHRKGVKKMMFMAAFEEIMEGFGCDLNTAIQLYQRGTVWEDV
tara:strand:+ start:156 stop:341 length:186 start_codon:yes stop_codon:yes gene_type:complete